MKIGKCLKCDAIGTITEDHVIPEWYLKVMANFLIKVPEKQIHLICQKCNSEKGGKVDYADEVTRGLAKALVDKLQSLINPNQ